MLLRGTAAAVGIALVNTLVPDPIACLLNDVSQCAHEDHFHP